MSHSPVGSTARLIDDDDVRVIVVGLRELGQLLADQASGFTVATIDADADARAEIAQRVRGSSRAGGKLEFRDLSERDVAGPVAARSPQRQGQPPDRFEVAAYMLGLPNDDV